MAILYTISAPSGAGKTTVVAELLRKIPQLQLSISYTTRVPRAKEQNAKDYFFVDETKFERLKNSGVFLEYATVFGNQYGTSKDFVQQKLAAGTDLILEINWEGAATIKQQLPSTVGIFILPPSLAVLEQRLNKRGQDSKQVIAERLQQSLQEISHYKSADYIIVNDNFEQAIAQLQAIFKSVPLHRSHFLKQRQLPEILKKLDNLY